MLRIKQGKLEIFILIFHCHLGKSPNYEVQHKGNLMFDYLLIFLVTKGNLPQVTCSLSLETKGFHCFSKK